jgi:hypothetical protein
MSIGSFSLQFAPLLPWPWLAAASVVAVGLLAFSFWRRARGSSWRLLALAAVLGALANPSAVQEDRNYLSDVAVVVVDDSESQNVPPRQAQTAAALAEVEKRIKDIPGLELRVIHGGNNPTSEASDGGGTRLFSALARGIADLPATRIAGAIVISDGQIHDVPADLDALGFHAPVHLLLSGLPDEADRRLVVVASPSFGLVDKPVTFKLRIEDSAAPADSQAKLTILKDGKPLPSYMLPIGRDMSIDLALDHGGQNIFEFSVEPGQKELSLANNSAVVLVNGVRDRLRVLLISGEPHAGERAWRALLKSDPSVDLVHFTILRPPEKQDATPINELSLIAFPVRDLFELKLKEFNLVIFDRYRREGVLPRAYFENIANYVEQGGALLDSAGPAFASPYSLYHSPLGDVLPAEPTGQVLEQPFLPELTLMGRRHPVTSGLEGAGSPGHSATWGRWFRQIEATTREGVSVMSGIGDRPLLVLNRVGKGRTAQLLSDQIWLWSRGYQGGGPQAELLRRVAHWLMKEPDLEEEDLRASVVDGRIEILRRSLSDKPVTVHVTTPAGNKADVGLKDQGDGRQTGSLAVAETGLYRLTDGRHLAFAASGPLNPLEIADLHSTAEKMQPLLTASGGRAFRLSDGHLPEIRKVQAGHATSGSNWLGLLASQDYVVTGIRQMSLLPTYAGLILGLGALLLAWRREGR